MFRPKCQTLETPVAIKNHKSSRFAETPNFHENNSIKVSDFLRQKVKKFKYILYKFENSYLEHGLAMIPKVLVQSGEPHLQQPQIGFSDLRRNGPRSSDDISNAQQEKEKAQSWNLPSGILPAGKIQIEIL